MMPFDAMKFKTLFRLMMKVIGVVFVGLALPRVVGAITGGASLYVANQGMPTGLSPVYLWQWGLSSVGPVLQLALGLYLFFGGKWIVDKAIPSNRPYCPECGYPLSSRRGDHCPECGTKLPNDTPGG